MTATRTAKLRMRRATVELATAQDSVDRQLAPWRAAFNRRRTVWIVAGGFASGLALAWLPRRLWSRIGALAGSCAALAARSVLTPMIAGALIARKAPPASSVNATGATPGESLIGTGSASFQDRDGDR